MEITKKNSKVKVLIVGDIMLDRYWRGSVSRISPEEPVIFVPVLFPGFLLGLRQAVEANHSAVVSAIVRERKRLWNLTFVE